MIRRPRGIESALRRVNCLIWESLQPENMRQRTPRCHALIKLKAGDMRPLGGHDVLAQRAIELPPGAPLIAQIVLRRRYESVTAKPVGRVTLFDCDRAKSLREPKRRAIFSDIDP